MTHRSVRLMGEAIAAIAAASDDDDEGVDLVNTSTGRWRTTQQVQDTEFGDEDYL